MFNVKVAASETYRNTDRPAIFKSLLQQLQYFNIYQDHLIYFNGEAEVSKLLGGEYNDRRGSDLDTDVGYKDKIFVEMRYEEAGFNDRLDSNHNGNKTTPALWMEPITGSSIRLVQEGVRYSITINKYFKDRTTARTFKTRITNGILTSHLNSYFSVDTHYPVSPQILACYYEIYERLLKANKVDTVKYDSFIPWFRGHSEVPTDIISNLIGNNNCLVFKQNLADNGIDHGDVVQMNQVTQGGYKGQYEVTWEYSFHWNTHTDWELEYPIQICQQLMDPQWMPEIHYENLVDRPTRRFLESKLSSVIFGDKGPSEIVYHALPKEDNWRPPSVYWMSPQLQVLVMMEDVPGEQVVLNIKDIQGFDWNPEFLKYILKYHNKITTYHKSPLQFKLYSDNLQVVDDQVVLRENGDLVITRPATLTANYRLTFELDYAIRQYDEECVNDILTDREWGRWILDKMFPQYPFGPDWGEGGYKDWVDFHNEIEQGDGEEILPWPRGTMGMAILAYNETQLRS